MVKAFSPKPTLDFPVFGPEENDRIAQEQERRINVPGVGKVLLPSAETAMFGKPGVIQEVKQESPTFGSLINANFFGGNPLGSFIDDVYTATEIPDEITLKQTPDDFNPLNDIIGYEEYQERLIEAETPYQLAFIKRRIDKEREYRKVQEDGGWLNVVAGLATGIVDPINLIPFSTAAKISLKAGESFLKMGAATARANILSLSASELLLHSTQETRTFGESAANITAGTLLSGVLGGAIGGISAYRASNRTFGELANALENDLKIPKEGENYLGGDKILITSEDLSNDTNIYKSLGAAAPNKTDAKLRKILGQGFAEKAAGNPVVRTATSESIETRRVAQELVDTGLQYQDNALGIASPMPVSTIVEQVKRERLTVLFNTTSDAFAKYTKREGPLPASKRTVIVDAYGIAAKNNLLSLEEFKVEVAKALRRRESHPVQEVREAATILRKDVLNYLRDYSIDVGLLDEKYRRDDTDYVHRLYDKEKIVTQREDFKRIVQDWLRGDAELALDNTELGEVSEQIIQNILGGNADRVQYSGMLMQTKKRGPLKERVFNIPDLMIEDFLVNDIEVILKRYINTMAADATVQSKFGSLDLKDQIGKIREDYQAKINNIKVKDPSLLQRRSALLEEHDRNYQERIASITEPNELKLLRDSYAQERQFIEQATPAEVLSRRNAIKVLDQRFQEEQKNFQEKLGKLPEHSDKMKARQEKMILDYQTSRNSILNAKPKSVVILEKINASRDAELNALQLSDPNYEIRAIDINNKYDNMINQLGVTDKDGLKKIKALEKARDKDISDIQLMVEQIRGTFNLNASKVLDAYSGAQWLNLAKSLNYARLLGGQGISSAFDVGGIVFVHGIKNTIGDTLVSFVRNFGSILKKSKSSVYLERLQEIKDLAVVNEMLLGTRIQAISDISLSYTAGGLEKVSRKMTKATTLLSGINWINDKTKTMAAYVGAAKILRASVSKSLKDKEIIALASYGIDKRMLSRIGEQFKKFGKKDKGVLVAGVSGWTDREAAEVFKLAISRLVDNTVITPRLEKPLFFSTQLGGLLGQFKSWGFAAYQRYFLAGLQRKDAEVVQGVASMVGLGVLQQVLRDYIDHGEVKERDVEEWVTTGINRSGVLGYLTDATSMANNFTGGFIGRVTGLEKEGHFYSAQKAIESLSPTFGIAGHGFGILSNLLDGEKKLDSRTLYSIRQLIPTQNAFMVRKIWDYAENQLRDSLGLQLRGQKKQKKTVY
ncbi:MAG: hypothetical protein K0M45_00300 [Candidatus Paracaedibacteraceae bacterium]|nr:hypothetical protein [Candidatus Paracaedibacteraceae bacterium]